MFIILHDHCIIVNPFSLFRRFLDVLNKFYRSFLDIIFLFCAIYLYFEDSSKSKTKIPFDFTSKQKDKPFDWRP